MKSNDYIRWIRSKIGHEKIILVFAGGCVLMQAEKFCSNVVEIVKSGDFLVGQSKLGKHLRWLLSEK